MIFFFCLLACLLLEPDDFASRLGLLQQASERASEKVLHQGWLDLVARRWKKPKGERERGVGAKLRARNSDVF